MTREQRAAQQTAEQVEAARRFLRSYPDRSASEAARWAVTGSNRAGGFHSPAVKRQIAAVAAALLAQ